MQSTPISVDRLSQLLDVLIVSAADNDLVAWDAASSKFKNQNAAAVGVAAASHTHTASQITDFTEAVQDVVGGFFADTSTINITYNDGANSLIADLITAGLPEFVGDSGSGGVKGAVPAPGTGDATKFLRGDGTWQTVSGGGGGGALDDLTDVATSGQAAGMQLVYAGSGWVPDQYSVPFIKAKVAAVGNVNLATDCENGDTLNGVVLATNDVIFTPDQSTGADRRLWVVKATGAPDPHPLMPTGQVISQFMVAVSEGTGKKDRIWLQTANTATVGTNTLTWAIINESSADQVAGTVYAGPVSGSDAAPTFRAIVVSDLPAVAQTDRPNKLINGMFRTWGHTYNSSGVAISDGAYSGPTGWFFLVSGNLCEISIGTGLGNSSESLIITNNSGSNRRIAISQFVEFYDVKSLRGKEVTFSIKVKRSSAGNVRAALVNWTGTANAPTKDIVNSWTNGTYSEGNFFISSGSLDIIGVSSAVSVGTSATEVKITGTVGGAANNLQVFVWTEDEISDTGTIEFSEAVLNKGAYPILFDAQHYPAEIIDCEYRCRIHNSDANQTDAILGWGHGASTTVAVCQVPLGHGMRVVPTLVYTGSDWQVADSVGARQDVTALAISSTVSSRKTLFMTATVASGLTVGRGMATVADTNAGRWLVFDAEIGT